MRASKSGGCRFTAKNYNVMGAIKTNRVIYPANSKISIADYAKTFTQDAFHSVTVKGVEYSVFRHVVKLNGIEKAAVHLTYPKDSFGAKSALRVFLCTDLDLSDDEILEHYEHRWSIETFFKLQKKYFGLSNFMVRSKKPLTDFCLFYPLLIFSLLLL